MAKDRAAGSRSLGEHGFHGLGRGSRPLSGASGRINLAIYWGTLRRQLLSRLGGTRQQPDYGHNCRWGRQALPGAHGRHDLELHRAALQREFLSRLGEHQTTIQSMEQLAWEGALFIRRTATARSGYTEARPATATLVLDGWNSTTIPRLQDREFSLAAICTSSTWIIRYGNTRGHPVTGAVVPAGGCSMITRIRSSPWPTE